MSKEIPIDSTCSTSLTHIREKWSILQTKKNKYKAEGWTAVHDLNVGQCASNWKVRQQQVGTMKYATVHQFEINVDVYIWRQTSESYMVLHSCCKQSGMHISEYLHFRIHISMQTNNNFHQIRYLWTIGHVTQAIVPSMP